MATTPGMNVAILKGLSAPVTSQTVHDLQAWQRAEGGGASFNPFNTTEGYAGASNYNSVGVKNYPTSNAGIAATLATLNNGRYGRIIQSLRQGGDPSAFSSAVGTSPWGTSGSLVANILKAPYSAKSTSNSAPPAPAMGSSKGTSTSPRTGLINFLLKNSTSLLSGGFGENPGELANLFAQKPASTSAGNTAPERNIFSPSGLAGGFLPKGAQYTQERADQGRDLMTNPGGVIVSPGKGTVLHVLSDPNGFGTQYPIVQFTSGPYAGKIMYVGHTHSALAPGAKFDVGTVLGHTGATGNEPWNGNASKPGWAEIGYAPGGVPGRFGQPVPFGG